MMMQSRVRKAALATHLTCSVGWIGAVAAYVVLGIAATRSRDAATVRGAWVAMELTGWYVIVPLALGSLLTGVVMSVGTKWGLFRHYWVVFALGLTTFATTILLFHMPDVSALAGVARAAKPAELRELGGDLFHSTLGLVVLLAIQVLNIYKPPGLTRYGWRRQQEQRRQTATRVP